MTKNTCCFTGHRYISRAKIPYIKARLSVLILKMIKLGVTDFICGGALGFDTIAAKMVLEFRRIFPSISLILYLPCYEQTKNWLDSDKNVYNEILKKADRVVYTSEKYYSGCMHKRNRAMIEASSYCIAYLTKNEGGTYFTVNYAEKNGTTVFFI